MSSPIFKSKRHDDGVSPEITVTPPSGLTFNLQEAGMTVYLVARLPDAPAHKIRGVAVVTGPWTVRYDPTKLDVNTIGTYDVELSAVRANGKQITFPTEKDKNLKWIIDTDADNQ